MAKKSSYSTNMKLWTDKVYITYILFNFFGLLQKTKCRKMNKIKICITNNSKPEKNCEI